MEDAGSWIDKSNILLEHVFLDRRIEAKNSLAVRGCGCYYHPGARVNVVNVI